MSSQLSQLCRDAARELERDEELARFFGENWPRVQQGVLEKLEEMVRNEDEGIIPPAGTRDVGLSRMVADLFPKYSGVGVMLREVEQYYEEI